MAPLVSADPVARLRTGPVDGAFPVSTAVAAAYIAPSDAPTGVPTLSSFTVDACVLRSGYTTVVHDFSEESPPLAVRRTRG